MNRTIENLRNTIKGRIYIYCENEKIGKQFLQDAENEGYRFGRIRPTENSWANIIALEHKKQLSFVGFAGHMNFQCNGGSDGNLTRIDYKKYINGEESFLFENKPLKEITVDSETHGKITIIGNQSFDASIKLKELMSDYEDIDALCDKIESEFDVIVIFDEG